MIKSVLLLALSLVLALHPVTLLGQKNIEVKEQSVEMSMGSQTGYSIFLEEADQKNINDIVKNLLGEIQKKPDIEKISKNEFKVDNILITGISDQPIDVYMLFDETKEGVLLTGFFDMGTSFLSARNFPDNAGGGVRFMQKVGLRVEKIRLEGLVEEANDKLKAMESDSENLAKDKQKLEDMIADCEQKIAQARKDIEQNNRDQENKKKEIESFKGELNTLHEEYGKYKDN